MRIGIEQASHKVYVSIAQIQNGSMTMPKLFCVPLLVKDNIDVVGVATTNGAAALQDNFPSQDAVQVSCFSISCVSALQLWYFEVSIIQSAIIRQDSDHQCCICMDTYMRICLL